jgi:uncharacterized protein YwbE
VLGVLTRIENQPHDAGVRLSAGQIGSLCVAAITRPDENRNSPNPESRPLKADRVESPEDWRGDFRHPHGEHLRPARGKPGRRLQLNPSGTVLLVAGSPLRIYSHGFQSMRVVTIPQEIARKPLFSVVIPACKRAAALRNRLDAASMSRSLWRQPGTGTSARGGLREAHPWSMRPLPLCSASLRPISAFVRRLSLRPGRVLISWQVRLPRPGWCSP